MPNTRTRLTTQLLLLIGVLVTMPALAPALTRIGEGDIQVNTRDNATRVEIQLPQATELRVVDEIERDQYFFIDIYNAQAAFPDKLIPVEDGVLRAIQTVNYPDLQVLRLVFFPAHKTNFRVADAASAFVYEPTPARASKIPENQRHPSRYIVIDTVKYRHYPLPALGAAPPAEIATASLRSTSGPRRKRLVVIDPGHGGKDPGAQSVKRIDGRILDEKDVVLAVGLELKRLLNKTPNIQAVMTRETDKYVGLRERVEFTEKLEADLFVSIHANATRFHRNSETARGIEFYFLSNRSRPDAHALEVAENREGMEELDEAASEQWDMIRQNLIQDILEVQRGMGSQVSDFLNQSFLDDPYFKHYNRGVKQAAFRVLLNRVTPSVLVEVGFIDHPREVVSLANDDFQKRIAKRLANGVLAYFSQLDTEIDFYQYQIN